MPTIHEFLSPGADGLEPRLARFEPGDRVRVTEGRFNGKLGTVVSDDDAGFFVKLDGPDNWTWALGHHKAEAVDVVTELGGLVP